ncbi:MAG: hypothetical protein ABI560_02060, partial [Myxococcales bacterium]
RTRRNYFYPRCYCVRPAPAVEHRSTAQRREDLGLNDAYYPVQQNAGHRRRRDGDGESDQSR